MTSSTGATARPPASGPQAAALQLRCFFDPLCGWCYGAGPAWQVLQAQPDIHLELAPVGLFAGSGARCMEPEFAAYAWANDQRIQALTGQPFSAAYREQVLGASGQAFDSDPINQVLCVVQALAPERELEVLQAVQRARYVQGLDSSQPAVLLAVLQHLGLEAPAQAWRDDAGLWRARNQERVRAARQRWQQLGLQGVPALQVLGPGRERLITGLALYGPPEVLLGQVRAMECLL